MSNIDYEKFTPEIIEALNYYVYRLIDPRNGETFYVGKGKGNRVFEHARGVIDTKIDKNEDPLSQKLSRIKTIIDSGLNVIHVIHRRGMDNKTAYHVEGALIDVYLGLTNVVKGHGVQEHGLMHTRDVISNFYAQKAEFEHKILLISVNRSALLEDDINYYESVRYAWKLNKSKAEKADYILATVQGVIKKVFIAEEWLDATSKNFPGRESVEGRFGFNGKEAPEEIQKLYVGKRIPDEYRKKGASNPIKYTW